MKRFKKFSAVTVLVLVMSIVLASCGFINGIFPKPDDPNDGPPVNLPSIATTQRSEVNPSFVNPVEDGVSVPARIDTDTVLRCAYYDGDSNFFLIDAGIIRRTFVSQVFQTHYIGIATGFTRRETNETIITNSMSEAVRESVSVTRFSQQSHTANTSFSVKSSAGASAFGISASVETTVSASWTGEWTNSSTNAQNNKRSLQTQTSELARRAEEETTTFDVRGMPHGFYRYGMYSTIQVWVIVETNADNSSLLSFSPVAVPSSANPLFAWSFCERGDFDNSPESGGIEFYEGFYRYLPNPRDVDIIPPTPYTITFYTGGFVGGGEAVASMSAYPNSRIDLPTPVHNNPAMRFAGWRTGGSTYWDGTEVEGNAFRVTGNITLRARWEVATQENRIAAGYEHGYKIDAHGRLWAWGNAANHRLGGGSNTGRVSMPQLVGEGGLLGGARAVSVVAPTAGDFGLAIDEQGRLWGWGRNDRQQLHLSTSGNTTNLAIPMPRQISVGGEQSRIVAIAAGGSGNHGTSFAIDYRGRLWGWGSNGNGRLGIGRPQAGTNALYWTAWGQHVNSAGRMNDRPVVAIASGMGFGVYHSQTLAIDYQGGLWAWGTNSNGQLGIGVGSGTFEIPQLVNANGRMGNSRASAVATGRDFSFVIDYAGRLWGFGGNSNNRAGLGDTNRDYNVPTLVNGTGRFGDVNVVSITAGSFGGAAIDELGRLWTWGRNHVGQIGNGTTGEYSGRTNPTHINVGSRMNGLEIIEVAAGHRNKLAVDINGNIWAWGYNNQSQLGDGTTATRNTPRHIA